MSLKKQRTGKIGVNAVEGVTLDTLEWGWQEIASENDDAFDGLMLVRRKDTNTGEMIHVQVKCGPSFYSAPTRDRPNHFGVKLPESYIQEHRPRWNLVPGPSILTYVDKETKQVWWTDLRDEEMYPESNRNVILVPVNNKLGEHSKGIIRRLKGNVQMRFNIPEVEEDSDYKYFISNKLTQYDIGKNFYDFWKVSPRSSACFGQINISRVGWRHITRNERGMVSILDSMRLLGAAKAIVENVNKAFQCTAPQVTVRGNVEEFKDFLSLRAKVNFSSKSQRIVQVILKRKRTRDLITGETNQKVWFYSVFEPKIIS